MTRFSSGVGQYATGERHVFVTGDGYRPDGTAPGVIVCHGYNGNATIAAPGGGLEALCRLLAAAGFATLAADLGGASTWGTDVAQDRIGDAKTYLQGTLGARSGPVALVVASMGAVNGYDWAAAHGASVSCVAGTCPAVGLADVHDNDRGGLASAVETAWTNLAGYQAAVATHDPAQNTPALAGFPSKLWYASDDTIVVPSVVTSFAAAIGATTSNMGAVGHTVGAVPPAEVLAFIGAHT